MVFELDELNPATDEYLATVMRCAAACRHKMTADEWVMVCQQLDRISAYSILFELSIIEPKLKPPPVKPETPGPARSVRAPGSGASGA